MTGVLTAGPTRVLTMMSKTDSKGETELPLGNFQFQFASAVIDPEDEGKSLPTAVVDSEDEGKMFRAAPLPSRQLCLLWLSTKF